MKENGKLAIIKNGSGVLCYYFRWWEFPPQPAAPIRRKREVGRVDSMTLEQAEAVIKPWKLATDANRPGPHNIRTMGELIAHFRRTEMHSLDEPADTHESTQTEKDENDRAWSTEDRYDSLLTARIEPFWDKVPLELVNAGEVERWMRTLKCFPRGRKNRQKDDSRQKPLAPGSKAKIRNLMSLIFNHAIRWGIFATNPITGPVRKSGVRQSSKREEIPDILELDEMRSILAELGIRERALISLDMTTGLRRSELAGLQWWDIDFDNLVIHVVRAVVDQRTGECKTEASAKPVPIDQYTADDLKAWRSVTKYRKPGDWVFATDSNRAGEEKRGKQPLWLSKVMQYHIQPLVKRLGINKRVGWHTFRRTFTTLLTANKENVKVVQELLRHASSKITMDTYAQAQMVDKRRAQLRIATTLHRPERKARERHALSPRGEHRRSVASRM